MTRSPESSSASIVVHSRQDPANRANRACSSASSRGMNDRPRSCPWGCSTEAPASLPPPHPPPRGVGRGGNDEALVHAPRRRLGEHGAPVGHHEGLVAL